MHIKHETIISNPKVEIVRYIVLGEERMIYLTISKNIRVS